MYGMASSANSAWSAMGPGYPARRRRVHRGALIGWRSSMLEQAVDVRGGCRTVEEESLCQIETGVARSLDRHLVLHAERDHAKVDRVRRRDHIGYASVQAVDDARVEFDHVERERPERLEQLDDGVAQLGRPGRGGSRRRAEVVDHDLHA